MTAYNYANKASSTSYIYGNTNSTTYTYPSNAQLSATPGLYYGFGAFTYSGSEDFGLYVPTYTYANKN